MSPRPVQERRVGWLSALLLFTVFSSGALVGAAVLDRAQAAPASVSLSGASPEHFEALDLTVEQRWEIDRILAARQPAVDSIVQHSIQSLQALMEAADGEVREILSPEQLERYEAVLLGQPRVRAVRRTTDPAGNTTVDTIG